MSDIYRISGNGYHDWDNMVSLPSDDHAPAALQKAKLSRAAEAARGTAAFLAGLTQLGCASYSGPVCESGSEPKLWPGSGGVEARNPSDPTAPLKIKLSALEDGVEALYFFSIANCDGGTKNMRVLVPAFSSEPFLPDADGNVSITGIYNRQNWPTTSAIMAELIYYDPKANVEQSKSFPLWKPGTEDEIITHQSCEYGAAPTAGGLTSSRGASVPYKGMSRISAFPVECDSTSDDLSAEFFINGAAFGPTQVSGREYYIEPTFTRTGNNTIIAFIKDTLRGGDAVTSSSLNIYVKATEAAVDIYARPTDEGPIARRQMTLQAGFVSEVPRDGLNFAWEVRDSLGVLVNITQASGQQVSFLPMTDGIYSVKLTVTGDTLSEPIIKNGMVTIYKFSAPQVGLSGNQNPDGGTAVNYRTILLPQDRPVGSEDEGALCTYKLSHVSSTGQSVVDFDNVQQPCSGNGQTINFPTVVNQTAYLLEVDVTGADDSYHLSKTLPITVWPTSIDKPKADFGVLYQDDGAIPYRAVSLQGNVTNASGTLSYVWEIRDNDGVLLASQPAAAKNSSYEFTQSGVYQTTLKVYQDGIPDPIARTSQTVIIYPFPKPEAVVSINDNQTVYSGKDVMLTSSLGRRWAEDNDATYAWKITHKGTVNGGLGDVVDLDPTSPAAQKPFLLFNFNESKTYTVELTVTGRHNGQDVYVEKSTVILDVFAPWNGLPSAVINGNLKYSYKQNESISGLTASPDDPNATFNWTIIQPDGTQLNRSGKTIFSSPPFIFSQTGTYFFKTEVVGADGVTKNFAYRSVDVYPATTNLPSVGIAGPYSATANQTVNLTGNSDDPAATYVWTITPPSGPVQTVNGKTLNNYLLNQIGDWDFKLTVTSADGLVKNAKIHSVSVYPPSVQIPTAVIDTNLKYAYQIGSTITNISGYSDDPAATYRWIITKPDGSFQTINSRTISSFTFSLPGDYDLKLEVTASDGKTKNTEIRSVTVVPTSVDTPAFFQSIPYAAQVATSIPMSILNLSNPNWTISWNYGDGSAAGNGASVNHTYAAAGKYNIVTTLTSTIDPSIKITVPFAITVTTYPVPNIGIEAASSAPVSTPVSFTVPNPTPGATYTWLFPDGTTPTGTSVSKTFATRGDFQVKVTGNNNGATNSITHNITIY